MLESFLLLLLTVLQFKEIVLLVHEGEKMVPHDGNRVEETEDGKDRDVGEGEREMEGSRDR